MKTEKSSSDLESEIIFRDMCAHCGTCGAFCPHIVYQDDGIPKVLDSCNETVGVCYNSCPRAGLNVSSLEQKMFGKTREDEIFGVYSDKVLVTADKKSILNALIETAFKHKMIDAMVVPKNKSKKPVNNVGVVVKDPKKLPELSGANLNYTGPLNPGINDAYQDNCKAVGLIGNPCHNQGATKVFYSDFKTGVGVLKLKLAVMCAAGGAKGCIYCIDYAGEFADISYSDMGQEKGNGVLLIRTPLGKELYDLAIKDKALKMVSNEPNIEKITDLASKKKKRNVRNILKKDMGKIGYLELTDKDLETYFK